MMSLSRTRHLNIHKLNEARLNRSHPRKKRRMRFPRFCLTQPHPYIYPSLLQQRCAAPIYAGVGVDDGYEAAGYSRLNERIGAGRGLSVMAARFQRDIAARSTRSAACDLERDGFGMRAAAVLRCALPDNFPIFNKDTANGRIFCRAAKLLRAEVQRAPHVI